MASLEDTRVEDVARRPHRRRRAKLSAAKPSEKDQPVDPAVEAETARSVRYGSIAMIVAMLVLLVFNSAGLKTWVRNLPGNATTDFIVTQTDRWHGLMESFGLTLPKAMVQNAVAEFRAADWSDAVGVKEVIAADGGSGARCEGAATGAGARGDAVSSPDGAVRGNRCPQDGDGLHESQD